MASSLGNRLLPPVSHWRQDFFFVDDAEDFFRDILYRSHAVYLVVHTQVPIKLDQRMRLFTVSPETLQNQIFPIIRPVDQRRTAYVANLVAPGRFAVSVIDLSAFRTHQPPDEALFTSEPLGIGREFDDRKFVVIAHLSTESLRLRNVPGISIQDKSVLAVVPLDAFCN